VHCDTLRVCGLATRLFFDPGKPRLTVRPVGLIAALTKFYSGSDIAAGWK
jgi:hypothetical protein